MTFPQIKSQPPLWAKNYTRCVAEIQWCFTFQIAHTLLEDLDIEPDNSVRYADSSNRVQVTQILQLEEGTDERNVILSSGNCNC